MKQSKLRRKRVFRYAILYFTLFIVFMALMIGPAVAGKYIPVDKFLGSFTSGDMYLVQPNNLINNNTLNTTETGTGAPSRATASSTRGADRVRLF